MRGEAQSTFKSSIIIGTGILISRILGLVRDKVIAFFISRELRDLFFIGLMIPNTLSRLLGEGAFSSGFLPIFSRMSSAGEDDRLNELTSVILNVVCL
ncbi:MAG: lipid II flippase MurJ, partial [Candidatus Hydrogenedentota bacterium]